MPGVISELTCSRLFGEWWHVWLLTCGYRDHGSDGDIPNLLGHVFCCWLGPLYVSSGVG